MLILARVAVAVAVFLLFVPSLSFALSDDFESYTLGGWPGAPWIAAANAVSDPASNIIAADPMDAGNQVLQLRGQLGGTWAASASRGEAFAPSFVFSIDVFNGSETLSGGHPERAYMYMRNGPGCCPPSRLLIGFKGDGTVIASDSTVLQTYATETWYNVQIAYSRVGSNLVLDYWIDGAFLGSFASSVSESFEASLNSLDLTAQEGTALFDNVVVTPEPSTALLLGLGLAALGGAQKRTAQNRK